MDEEEAPDWAKPPSPPPAPPPESSSAATGVRNGEDIDVAPANTAGGNNNNNLDLLTFSPTIVDGKHIADDRDEVKPSDSNNNNTSSDLFGFGTDPSSSSSSAVAATSTPTTEQQQQQQQQAPSPAAEETGDLLDLMGGAENGTTGNNKNTNTDNNNNNNNNDLLMMNDNPPEASPATTIAPLDILVTNCTTKATRPQEIPVNNTDANTTASPATQPPKVEATSSAGSSGVIPAAGGESSNNNIPASSTPPATNSTTSEERKPGTPSSEAIPTNEESTTKQDTTTNNNSDSSKDLKSDNSNSSSLEKTAEGNQNTPEQQQEQSNEISASAKERIAFLEMELAKSKAALDTFKQQGENSENESAELIMALQGNLQQQMSLKAEAENKARLADAKIAELQQSIESKEEEIEANSDMQKVLQEHMTDKAEAENKVIQFMNRNKELEAKVSDQSTEIDNLQRNLVEAREAKAAQEDELIKIREQRDEQERKEIALTNRLNAAKKKEGVQSNLAEQYEDEIKAIEQDWQTAKKELTEVTEKKNILEKELEGLKATSEERIRRAERALADEQTLNEERKQKMKAFVENRAEELRQTKSDNDALQAELNQTNQSLMDLNNRWKQLHAQWVQSQTRNRELQRDLNRIKKDSENLHKVGDTLEMRLTRSATETEEHKNKRLAAKHELMTVLRTLEAERELSAKLRDGLKFTFTPKALSQQQLLHEGLEDFETQLLKLSQRLGRPLPPANHNMAPPEDMTETSENSGVDDPTISQDASRPSRTDTEIQHLIAKLEYETQRVSQGIMALAGNIERMHMVLDASGKRTCYTVLGELLTTGSVSGPAAAAATREETTSITGSGPTRRLAAIRSDRYSQVPPAAP